MKKIYTILAGIFIVSSAQAQLSLDAVGSPATISFSGFTGAGFQPGGGGGMLDSDTWGVTGLSEGDVDFGATAVSGDFARGTTMGLETVGGIYAVDILGNQGLMVQPTADDFTPGSFVLQMINNTGTTLGSLNVSYTIYVLNDQNRSNSFNLSFSYDNVSYTDLPDADYISPEAADFSADIQPVAIAIAGLSIAAGDQFYLRWTGNDVGGAGNRDEFALDDISITGNEAGPLATYTYDTPDMTVNEGDLSGTFDVSISESTDCVLNFGYGPDATATPGFDYGLFGFTLEFSEGGPTMQTVEFGLVDDLTAEGTETGIIILESADGGCTAGADTILIITIEDNELVTPPIASFTTIGATADESIGTITGTVELTEPADCELQMYLDGATTMTEGLDYSFALPYNFVFNAAGPVSQSFDIDIIDDVEVEFSEMLLMNLIVLEGTCAIGAIADYEININDNDAIGPEYTEYAIAAVTTEDPDGVAESAGVKADLTGIVYGVNIWDGGLQFTLIDETGGIAVFSFDEDFGYTVTEGDEVNIKGTITQFNGLTQIEPDILTLISTGNSLKSPTNVSILNEATESDLVKVEIEDLGYTVVDPLQWLGDGSSFNVEFSDGTNTIIVRIDNNTELSSMSYETVFWAPLVWIEGLGTQFDTESPYHDGYQIMPRYAGDIQLDDEAIDQLDPSLINIYPNPTFGNLSFSGKENIEWLEIINQLGESVQLINVNNFETSIDVQQIPAGLYFLKIKTDSGIYSSNFIKQ